MRQKDSILKSTDMANKSTPRLLLVLFSLFYMTELLAAPPWQSLYPGIEYRQLSPSQLSPFAELHVFKLDLKRTSLKFCPTKKDRTTAKQNAKDNNALITVNGGFFSPTLTPLGLRVQDGKVRSPLKRISWWSVFYIKNQRAHIVTLNRYRHSRGVAFAIQAGPRLVVNNQIPSLKPGMAERTALGITPKGEVIILVSEHTSLSTNHLAHIMRDQLGIRYALNLDGGGSTQLFAQIGNFKRQITGLSRIPDPLCVYPR